MFVLPSIVTLLCAAPIGRAAPVHYHFKIEYVSDLDRTVVGGQYIHGVTTMNALVSLTTRDSAGGTIARFTIDSVGAELVGAATAVMDPSAPRFAKGASIEVFLVRGRIQGEPRESMNSVVVHLLVRPIQLLFNTDWSKAGSTATWNDTTSMAFQSSGGNARTGQTIAMWRVAGPREDAVTLDQSAVTSWVTDAKTDINGNRLDARVRYTETGSAHVVLQRDGRIGTAASRSTWESRETSGDTPRGVPSKGSITISVERIGGTTTTPSS